MGEIRPVSTGKRKGPLLSRVLVLSRISAPISTLAALKRIVLQHMLEKLITDRQRLLTMPKSCRRSCTDMLQSIAATQASQLSTLCSE